MKSLRGGLYLIYDWSLDLWRRDLWHRDLWYRNLGYRNLWHRWLLFFYNIVVLDFCDIFVPLRRLMLYENLVFESVLIIQHIIELVLRLG